MARPKERFCKRGHDTEEVGRIRKGYCKTCAEGGPYGPPRKHKPYSLEWERARVQRWLEIVKAEPLEKRQATTARTKEFESRYQRLEASLPTPVDA